MSSPGSSSSDLLADLDDLAGLIDDHVAAFGSLLDRFDLRAYSTVSPELTLPDCTVDSTVGQVRQDLLRQLNSGRDPSASYQADNLSVAEFAGLPDTATLGAAGITGPARVTFSVVTEDGYGEFAAVSSTLPMKRGNVTAEVLATKGASSASMQWVRAVTWRVPQLVEQFQNQILQTIQTHWDEFFPEGFPPPGFEDDPTGQRWFSTAWPHISAMVQQEAKAGNCGEFSATVYSRLLLDTGPDQHVMRVSMRGGWDHALVATSPVKVSKLADLPDEATIADGWASALVISWKKFKQRTNAYGASLKSEVEDADNYNMDTCRECKQSDPYSEDACAAKSRKAGDKIHKKCVGFIAIIGGTVRQGGSTGITKEAEGRIRELIKTMHEEVQKQAWYQESAKDAHEWSEDPHKALRKAKEEWQKEYDAWEAGAYKDWVDAGKQGPMPAAPQPPHQWMFGSQFGAPTEQVKDRRSTDERIDKCHSLIGTRVFDNEFIELIEHYRDHKAGEFHDLLVNWFTKDDPSRDAMMTNKAYYEPLFDFLASDGSPDAKVLACCKPPKMDEALFLAFCEYDDRAGLARVFKSDGTSYLQQVVFSAIDRMPDTRAEDWLTNLRATSDAHVLGYFEHGETGSKKLLGSDELRGLLFEVAKTLTGAELRSFVTAIASIDNKHVIAFFTHDDTARAAVVGDAESKESLFTAMETLAPAAVKSVYEALASADQKAYREATPERAAQIEASGAEV